MFPTPIDKWQPASRVLYKLSLPLALMIWLLPLIAVMVTSIRSSDELVQGNYWGWPEHVSLIANYREALTTSPMLHYFWNSVLITVPAVVGSIALAAMAGFALAVYSFRGNSVLFATFVAGNFVPIQILMIPVRDLSLELGLFNTVGALILFHVAFQTGFCALFLRNFIKQLPFELVEAARIEGANEWTVFFRIILPLIRPALMVAVIFRALDAIRIFDLVYVLTGVNESTMTMSVYARQQLIEFQRVGYGSAASTLLFFIVAALTVVYVVAGRVKLGDA